MVSALERMCSGSAMMRVADASGSNHPALNDSSVDMKNNSLHEYAQLAGFL